MIISHANKFLFVAVPKTATHAIRASLRPTLHKYDWEQQGLIGEKKQFPIKTLAKYKHGHLSCKLVKSFFPKGTWEIYFKFSFVRNPLDRFISTCFFLYKADNQMQRFPLEKMKTIIKNKRVLEKYLLFHPQNTYLCNDNDEIMVNFLGRYENLKNDFEKVKKALTLNTIIDLSFVNKTPNKKKIFDNELAQLVYQYYKKDYDLFNYKH